MRLACVPTTFYEMLPSVALEQQTETTQLRLHIHQRVLYEIATEDPKKEWS
jgi:hypothetical protein